MTSVISQPSKRQVAMPATRVLISNRWMRAKPVKTFATINRATGEEICQVSEAAAIGCGQQEDLAVLSLNFVRRADSLLKVRAFGHCYRATKLLLAFGVEPWAPES